MDGSALAVVPEEGWKRSAALERERESEISTVRRSFVLE